MSNKWECVIMSRVSHLSGMFWRIQGFFFSPECPSQGLQLPGLQNPRPVLCLPRGPSPGTLGDTVSTQRPRLAEVGPTWTGLPWQGIWGHSPIHGAQPAAGDTGVPGRTAPIQG